MNNKYKYLLKNVLLFSLSGFVPKFMSLIIVPIYTIYLTTAEYGIYDLINTTAQFMLPIFSLTVYDAVMRYVLDDSYEKKGVLSCSVWIILSGTIVLSLLTYTALKLNIIHFEKSYLQFFIIIYLFNAFNSAFSRFCRGIDKVNIIVISTIASSAVILFGSVLLVVALKMGLTGFLIANTVGLAVMTLVLFIGARLYKYISFKVPKRTFKDLLVYSFPLIFNALAWWVNTASDRYMVTWIAGISVSGIFAIAYKIPNLMNVFQGVFSQAWSISAIKEYDKNDTDGFMANLYSGLNLGLIIICSLLMLLCVPISRLLFSKDFFEAWHCVPPLLLSVLFNGAALFLGNIFAAVKDTKTVSFSTIIGAFVNIVCNYFLIRLYGAYGAAIATFLSYGVMLVIRRVKIKRYVAMKEEKLKIYMGYVLLLIQMCLAYYGNRFIVIEGIIFLALVLICQKTLINMVFDLLGFNKKLKIKNEYDYVVHLTKCGLRDLKPMEMPKSMSFETVYEYAKEHMVENIAYLAVQKLENKPSPEILSAWEERYMTMIYANNLRDEFREMLLKIFCKYGIKSTEIQGTVIKKLYPSPDLRQMSDIDIVVKAEDFEKIKTILESGGFDCCYSMGKDKKTPVELWAEREDGIILEFHVDYFHEKGNYFDIHNPFEKATVTNDGYSYEADKTNLYIYTILHFLRHWDGGCGIRRVMDLYVISHTLFEETDKTYVKEYMKNGGYESQVNDFLNLAEMWFGDEERRIHGKYQKIARIVYKSGAHGNPFKPLNFYLENKKSKIIAKIKYGIITIFPPKQRMYNRFLFLRKNRLPIVICWLYRLGVALRYDKKNGIAFFKEVFRYDI